MDVNDSELTGRALEESKEARELARLAIAYKSLTASHGFIHGDFSLQGLRESGWGVHLHPPHPEEKEKMVAIWKKYHGEENLGYLTDETESSEKDSDIDEAMVGNKLLFDHGLPSALELAYERTGTFAFMSLPIIAQDLIFKMICGPFLADSNRGAYDDHTKSYMQIDTDLNERTSFCKRLPTSFAHRTTRNLRKFAAVSHHFRKMMAKILWKEVGITHLVGENKATLLWLEMRPMIHQNICALTLHVYLYEDMDNWNDEEGLFSREQINKQTDFTNMCKYFSTKVTGLERLQLIMETFEDEIPNVLKSRKYFRYLQAVKSVIVKKEFQIVLRINPNEDFSAAHGFSLPDYWDEDSKRAEAVRAEWCEAMKPKYLHPLTKMLMPHSLQHVKPTPVDPSTLDNKARYLLERDDGADKTITKVDDIETYTGKVELKFELRYHHY